MIDLFVRVGLLFPSGESVMTKRNVYYLPGMGGRLSTSLRLAFRSGGFNIQGGEFPGEFGKLDLVGKLIA